MTKPEYDELRRELALLRERVAEISAARMRDVAALRAAISVLERKLESAAPSGIVWDERPPEMEQSEPEAPPVAPMPPPMPMEMAEEEAPLPVEPAPAPAASQEEGSFELRFGRVWLVRLGIALLVTGLVLLGNYAYKNWIRDLAPGVRLAALYLGAFALSGAGIRLGRREGLRRFGEVLLGGGLAFFYWCTYAAHHVGRLRVIESPVAAAMLLLAAAGVVVAVALKRNSRVTALVGLLLASYSTVLQPLGWMSAASNLTLAAAGMLLMGRAGWAGPGIAAMAGCYGAFFWWQIAGAAGGRPEDPAALWFLPPVWAVFALPGIAGVSSRFAAALEERGRAWFASANNLAFFALFSALWIWQRGQASYWLVPAVFGTVLLGLGWIGRGREAAGEPHFAQGLAALTLALVLKLEGFHLALALAGQSLGLALAFRRYQGKSELAFSLLAGTGAAAFTLAGLTAAMPGLEMEVAPLWSRGVVALLLGAAVFPLRAGVRRLEEKAPLAEFARAGALLLMAAGTATGLIAWCLHLSEDIRGPVAGVVGAGVAALMARLKRGDAFPELVFVVLPYALASLILIGVVDVWTPVWTPLLGGVVALACLAWWEKKSGEVLPAERAAVLSWLLALTAGAGAFQAIWQHASSEGGKVLGLAGVALGFAAAGRSVPRLGRLSLAGALMLPGVCAAGLPYWREAEGLLRFVPAVAALGVLGLTARPAAEQPGRRVAMVLARVFAALSWFCAWSRLETGPLADVLAATALGLMAAGLNGGGGRRFYPETMVFLGLAAVYLLTQAGEESWRMLDEARFPHGVAVVVALFAAGFFASGIKGRWMLFAACTMLALWSSQWMVWLAGAKVLAVSWTGLGFGLVVAGLGCKRAVLRQAGFVFFGMALLKLFCVDVWDFAAFGRIAAFLALGVAMVVLGFLYNRFAEVLKKLLESERDG